jgi:polyphosphate glucokinase
VTFYRKSEVNYAVNGSAGLFNMRPFGTNGPMLFGEPRFIEHFSMRFSRRYGQHEMTNTKPIQVLVVDIGGTHIKLLVTGNRTPVKIPSGPTMTPRKMVTQVQKAAAEWKYSKVSIGYPGPVLHGKPVSDPHNLGTGWVGFDFRKAFGRSVKLVNDAAMQAIGSYKGRRMLFLGLGTGLGSALIVDRVLEPLELAHLPYKDGRTYEDYIGLRGLERLGKKKWRRSVGDVVDRLKSALEADYVVIGGGNAKLLKALPAGARLGSNENAFRGAFRLWQTDSNWA